MPHHGVMSPVAAPEAPAATERPSLAVLAGLGREELAARLNQVLPGAEPGRVEVAAFNSSI
jgi:FXSXX-COOH protein